MPLLHFSLSRLLMAHIILSFIVSRSIWLGTVKTVAASQIGLSFHNQCRCSLQFVSLIQRILYLFSKLSINECMVFNCVLDTLYTRPLFHLNHIIHLKIRKINLEKICETSNFQAQEAVGWTEAVSGLCLEMRMLARTLRLKLRSPQDLRGQGLGPGNCLS